LIIARALAGVFGGNIATAMAYIADITEAKDRSRGMGIVGAAFGLGFICGPALGGVFAQIGVAIGSSPPFGESFPALVAAAICAVNGLFALRYLPESFKARDVSAVRGPRFQKIARALGTPVLGMVMALVFLNTFAMAHIEASLFLMVQEDRFWSLAQASFGFAYIGVIMVFTQGYLVRKWMPRFGERWMLVTGLLGSTFGYLLIAAGGPLWLLAVGVTLLGIGNGLATPSLSGSVSLLSSEQDQGVNLGVSQSLSSLARIVGPPSGGWLYGQIGHESPFLAAAGVIILALFVVWMGYRGLPQRGRVAA
jgi:MFS transporter, DHA1 family, tetracycline resistance protein